MKPLLLALIASASSAQSAVIYTETFPNATAVPINFNAVTWDALRNTTVPTAVNIGTLTTAVTNVTNLTGQGGVGGYGVRGTGSAGQSHYYTNEFAPVDRSLTEIDTISFYSNNALTTDQYRVTVQIGGSWYASSQTFFRDSATAGSSSNFGINGELETFNWSTAASSWRALTSTPFTSLQLGAVLGSPLPAGNLTGAGLLLQGATDNSANTGNMRFDTFQIATIPEPSALALTGLGLAALAFRRRK